MHSSTSPIRLRRLIVLGSVVACAAATAVGASAARTIAAPDVVERYAATHDPNSATAPDLIERYVTAHSLGASTAARVAVPDAVERYAATRDSNSATAPDVIERYVTVHSLGASTAIGVAAPDVVERYAATHDPNSATAPDLIERYVTAHSLGVAGVVPPVGPGRIAADSFRDTSGSIPATSRGHGGLDWLAFGIGAGAMLGLTLLLAALSFAAVAVRHRDGRLETS